MAAYDYYGYDANMYGYYGGRYGGANFYEQPSRGRVAGKCFYIAYVVDSCCSSSSNHRQFLEWPKQLKLLQRPLYLGRNMIVNSGKCQRMS